MIYAGTGHRPDKLYLEYSDEGLKILMKLAINFLKDKQVSGIISGMALGWDTALALAAVKLNVPLIAAVPFVGQELRWKPSDIERYHKLLGYAQWSGGKVIYVCKGGYSAKKMQTRNEFMVDGCNEVIALHDGSPGGTKNCLDYAKDRRKINNLWEEYQILVNLHKEGKLWQIKS